MSQGEAGTGSGEKGGEAARQREKPSRPNHRSPRTGGRHADVAEVGGPKGPEPTRYGDWEKGGRCTDF